jgi:acyl-coenzyme A synthetase/AMP-(fatty) acid ligase
MPGRTLLDVVQHGAPSDLAIVVPDGVRLTYRDLREQVAIAADRLAQLGIGRGDRVALVFPNSAEAIVLFLAASTAGTAAPLNAAYKEEEFRFYLSDTGARALVVPPGQAEAARRALPAGVSLVEAQVDEHGHVVMESSAARDVSRTAVEPGEDDVALVLHTSGTTSRFL